VLIETKNIEKSFGSHCALRDVSVGVKEGSVFGLLGPNGAGKTTLIRLINQIIFPDKGEILFDGRAMTGNDVREIGYLPEERGLYKKMKVGEQAVYLARLKGLSSHDATVRLKRWFQKFEIEEWWNRTVDQLSKGMQQKIQFIVTVIHDPKLLIFDEPFSGFDPVNATLLRNEIVDLHKKGATIILSTHNMTSVEELCDDIALIDHSHVVLHGNFREIRKTMSTNQYEVAVDASENEVLTTELPAWCHLVSQAGGEGGGHSYRFKLDEEKKANDLVELLLTRCRLQSFREVLPSMNDIFITTVTGKEARQ
jgi:ABC-2 type transport system ATP-binding protein